MIFSTLDNAERYAALHPLFLRAFEFMCDTDLRALAPGRHAIMGDELFVIIEHVHARDRADAQLECHRKYIDIQLVLEGIDEMGWKPLSECHTPAMDYSAQKDIQFFRDTPSAWIATPAGAFCIFFPEDAHAPLVCSSRRNDIPDNAEAALSAPIKSGLIHKAVFKIAVNPMRT